MQRTIQGAHLLGLLRSCQSLWTVADGTALATNAATSTACLTTSTSQRHFAYSFFSSLPPTSRSFASSSDSSSSSDSDSESPRIPSAATASSSDRVGVDRPYVAGDLDASSAVPSSSVRPDPVHGYAVLGFDDSQFMLYSQWKATQGPAALSSSEIPESLLASIGSGMRLNALKSYKLAELYSPRQLVEPPNELDGVLTDRALMYVQRPVPTNAEFAVKGHVRNREFLRAYLSEGGKIPHRKVTKLKNKFQVRLAKMVKTARKLAILPSQSKHPIYDD